jgi:hypothetical protein
MTGVQIAAANYSLSDMVTACHHLKTVVDGFLPLGFDPQSVSTSSSLTLALWRHS